MNESTPDTPIVVLRQNRSLLLKITIFIFCFGAFIFFGFTLPVIIAGSYTAGLADELSPLKRIFMFWGSLYLIPFFSYLLIMGIRHFGDFTFYPNRLEFQSFWFNRKASIPYSQMYVAVGKLGVSMTTTPLPSNRNHIKRFRAEYNSIFFPAGMFFDDRLIGNFTWGISKRWLNPQDGPKAIQILKEKALSVKYI
jgi:hypothetical protein